MECGLENGNLGTKLLKLIIMVLEDFETLDSLDLDEEEIFHKEKNEKKVSNDPGTEMQNVLESNYVKI